MEEDPFKASEVRFWSVRTIPKFLIRGLPRVITIFIGYIIIFVILLIIPEKNTSAMTKLLKIVTRLKLYFFGYKHLNITREDQLKIKNTDANVIVVNHSSYMDILLLAHLIPDAKFVASEWIARLPVLGKFGRSKCIYLKNDFSGNLTGVIQSELEKGTKIVFYSEGLCSRSDLLLKLRNGAFVPKMKILPIHVDYGKNYWVMGEQDMVMHAMTQICNRNNNVTIRVGKEYCPTEEDKKDVELFKENFRKYYAEIFNVKLSDKSYKDHPYFKMKL